MYSLFREMPSLKYRIVHHTLAQYPVILRSRNMQIKKHKNLQNQWMRTIERILQILVMSVLSFFFIWHVCNITRILFLCEPNSQRKKAIYFSL